MSILRLENVSLNLPGATNNPVLKQINYEVKQGDFIILLGSNGSGKSSLLKLLHRDYQPTSGQIYFMDKPISQFSTKAFSHHVATLTQNCSDSIFDALTVYENYLLLKKENNFTINHDKERQFLNEYLADFNVNLSKKLDLPVQQLSGGEKQALALAYCLLYPPQLLLLDEHTSALDPKTSDQIMQLTHKKVQEHRITCILTTHNLNIALKYGNTIIFIQNGTIANIYDEQNKASLTHDVLISGY